MRGPAFGHAIGGAAGVVGFHGSRFLLVPAPNSAPAAWPVAFARMRRARQYTSPNETGANRERPVSARPEPDLSPAPSLAIRAEEQRNVRRERYQISHLQMHPRGRALAVT